MKVVLSVPLLVETTVFRTELMLVAVMVSKLVGKLVQMMVCL